MKKSLTSVSPARIMLFLFFVAHFLYFTLLNRYHLYYQEQIQLFRFDWNYLEGFLAKPGGISEYIGTFFIQFYLIPLAGPVLATLAGILAYLLTKSILKRIGVSGIFFCLIPVMIIAALQSDHVYYFGHTAGYLLSLSLVSFCIALRNEKLRYPAAIAGIIALYPVAGGFAIVTSIVLIIYEIFFQAGKKRWVAITVFMLFSGIYPYLLWTGVYYQTIGSAWLTPILFISNEYTRYWLIALVAWIPLIILTEGIIRLVLRKPSVSLPWNLKTVLAGMAGFLIIAMLILKFAYDQRTEKLLGIDYHVQKGTYEKALEISVELEGSNPIAVYLTNLALARSGSLGDRLFHYHQIGSQGLKLDWGDDASAFFGSEVFYHISYINEAYHWAFEAMVSKGHSPRVLKRLVQTSVINGSYGVAEKFLNILDQTLFYRKFARQYRNYINVPELLQNDMEISEKQRYTVHADFFADVTDLEFVLIKLLENHPDNRNAFEYLMSLYLLDNNLNGFVENIYRLKDAGIKEIPVHYEEALLIYMADSQTEAIPEDYSVREETRQRFNDYIRTYSSFQGNPDRLPLFMKTRFGTTYWYYLQFM